jgi:hypothetical protein
VHDVWRVGGLRDPGVTIRVNLSQQNQGAKINHGQIDQRQDGRRGTAGRKETIHGTYVSVRISICDLGAGVREGADDAEWMLGQQESVLARRFGEKGTAGRSGGEAVERSGWRNSPHKARRLPGCVAHQSRAFHLSKQSVLCPACRDSLNLKGKIVPHSREGRCFAHRIVS